MQMRRAGRRQGSNQVLQIQISFCQAGSRERGSQAEAVIADIRLFTPSIPPPRRPAVELSASLREVTQCLEKAPTRAFSLLKVPTSAFTTIDTKLKNWCQNT